MSAENRGFRRSSAENRGFRRSRGAGWMLAGAVAVLALAAGGASSASARRSHQVGTSRHSNLRRRAPRVLLVGTYRGHRGRFHDIQAAVDAARRGDWILVAPGDWHERRTRMVPHGQGDDRAGAAVLIRTARLHLRGMSRDGVMVDGTKVGARRCSSAASDQNFGPKDAAGSPGGRNGIIVFRAPGVNVENLSACNFLTGDAGGGNQIWWDGGGASGGQVNMGIWAGSWLSATDTYFQDDNSPAGGYGIYSSNIEGPGHGLFAHDYANNMNDSGYYVGACPDCHMTLDHVQAQNSALGYSGTNSGGNVLVKNSEFDHNQDGFDTNSQNNDDIPSPQDGTCPHDKTNPKAPPNVQRTHSCWIFTHNYVHDNNNPNVPAKGAAAAGPVGTGMSISGGRHNIVTGNRFVDNGAWGLILVPFPDTEQPPDGARCQGGAQAGTASVPVCYFDDFGNEIANNTFTHNGFFGNLSNGDVAELSGANPNASSDGNCWHDNVDTQGRFTSDPGNIDSHSHCGQSYQGNPLASAFGIQVACDSQLLSSCPSTLLAKYPRATNIKLTPLPRRRGMPHPCRGVPTNPWCPGPRNHGHPQHRG